MGLIERLLGLVFGGGGAAVRETVEVFRENAEAGAQRTADFREAALAQHSAEFKIERKGGFDRFMDGLNRLPRPLLVLSVFGLFSAAMASPIWFAERMQGLSLVPEPMWWFFGVVVPFYFGGRHQMKGQEFQKSIARSVALAPAVVEGIKTIRALRHDSPGAADTKTEATLELASLELSENPAVDEWRAKRGDAESA